MLRRLLDWVLPGYDHDGNSPERDVHHPDNRPLMVSEAVPLAAAKAITEFSAKPATCGGLIEPQEAD